MKFSFHLVIKPKLAFALVALVLMATLGIPSPL